MRSVIALMLYEKDVLNVSSIHIAALLWSLPNDFRGYERGALE